MAGNHIVPDLVEAVRSYLAASLVTPTGNFSAVVGHNDYRLADEEGDGVLGRYIPTPHLVVSAELQDSETPVQCRVTITVRHSIEESTVTAHDADAEAAIDLMLAKVTADITADGQAFRCLDHGQTGPSFQRQGRAYETTFGMGVVAV